MEIKKVGVLGCGLMGAGIAQTAATAGFETIVREVSDDLIAKGFSGIEKSPVLDVLGFGPITIPQAAFDRTFEQRRNRLTFADGKPALTGFPNAKVQDKADFIEGQTGRKIGQQLVLL